MKSESVLNRRAILDLVNIILPPLSLLQPLLKPPTQPDSTYHFYWPKLMSAAFIAYLVKMSDSPANFLGLC